MLRPLILPSLLLLSVCALGQLRGKVVSISDGDTFTILVDEEQIKIRLHGIDCPEKSQDFGNVAKEFLSDLIFNKEVEVIQTDTDRYGRTIGKASINGVSINEQLLNAGLAWHYKYYDKNVTWAEFELEARKDKKGLWAQPNPTPPWDFRKQNKKDSQVVTN
jgi:micrococcal nuclease